MEITHLPEDNLFKTVVDGYTASSLISSGTANWISVIPSSPPKSEAGGSQLN